MRHNKQVSDLRKPQEMLIYASRRLANYPASRLVDAREHPDLFLLVITKGLQNNKWSRIDEVILCANKAPNAGIAGATARLGNAVSAQKNESKWSTYYFASPKVLLDFGRAGFGEFLFLRFIPPIPL